MYNVCTQWGDISPLNLSSLPTFKCISTCDNISATSLLLGPTRTRFSRPKCKTFLLREHTPRCMINST